jgi:hypothetical protein
MAVVRYSDFSLAFAIPRISSVEADSAGLGNYSTVD